MDHSPKKYSLKVRIAAFLILGLLFLGLLLVLTEFGFRASGKYPVSGFAYDPDLIWRLKRNHSETKQAGDQTLTISFNADGFRDKDHETGKAPGVKRIMVIGDSYTFGGIDYSDEQIFTAILEQNLNKDRSGAYEVMNVSVPAWATDQQLIYLVKEGIHYQPDHIILVASPNDIREAYCKKLYQLTAGGGFVRLPVKIDWKTRIGWHLANTSSFFQYLQQKVLRKNYGTFFDIFRHYSVNFGKEDATDWDRPLYLEDPFPEVRDAKKLFTLLIGEIDNICRQHEIRLLLAINPSKTEYLETTDSLYRPGAIAAFMGKVAGTYGIPYLNLYEKTKQLPDPLSIFISWEYHYNETGHRFVGDQLSAFFRAHQQ